MNYFFEKSINFKEEGWLLVLKIYQKKFTKVDISQPPKIFQIQILSVRQKKSSQQYLKLNFSLQFIFVFIFIQQSALKYRQIVTVKMSRPWKDAATLIVLARDAVKNSKYDYKVSIGCFMIKIKG